MIKRNPQNQAWTFFIDLKSAFDKVDHRILINKLKKMRTEGKLVNTI